MNSIAPPAPTATAPPSAATQGQATTPAATPDPVAAALQRAEQAARDKRMHEAAGICRDVLEANPANVTAGAMLGAILGQQGDITQGISLLERACAASPGNAAWHNNLCSLYRLRCRLDQALASGLEAVRLAPGNVGCLLNLGKVYMDRGEYDQAFLYFFTVLGRKPDDPEAHLAIGQILLMHGDFRPGWIEYEWRNKLDQAKGMIPTMSSPTWNGMTLRQGRILLICDQGFGDSLQFCRYIPMVAERCQEVVVGASADLAPLVLSIPGVGGCFVRWQEIPRHTSYALMSSLPAILGTELDTIPAKVPYISVDEAKVETWRALLAERIAAPGLRVGIVWAGRPTHPNDLRRSLRLEQLAPLLDVPDVQFVSLQKVVPARDAQTFAGLSGRIHDVSAELADFAATAALINTLDLVITVDSAVAHLAGALGCKVWVLMSTPSDWRWLLNRTDSPWYPTMRLFRQPAAGDWTSAIAAAAAALAAEG
jgi:Flp pilus assembly protein TadD